MAEFNWDSETVDTVRKYAMQNTVEYDGVGLTSAGTQPSTSNSIVTSPISPASSPIAVQADTSIPWTD